QPGDLTCFQNRRTRALRAHQVARPQARTETGMSQEPENWSDAPANVELREDEAHVWCASLEPPAARLATCLSLLAPAERERAARFYFEKDRRHFTVARAVLR